MHKSKFISVAVALALGTFSSALKAQQTSSPGSQDQVESKYVPVETYDPARNARSDIEQGVAEARRTGKHVLLEIGGNWCPWCHTLDRFFQEHSDVRQLREANFVVVDVYYGREKKNEQVLSHYSKDLGIPHLFVLDGDGHLLHSQHVVELEKNGNYDSEKMKEFLNKWSPKTGSAATADSNDAAVQQ